ncbi:MAG: hypothetical protein IPJ40_03040 [Saprospirales bacterium]|nr:hypothetical protein [Saprospirales bacterium]
MTKNRLHSILIRNKEFAGLMQQIAIATGAQVWVEDTHGSLLFGVRHDHPLHRIPVSVFGELLGNVSGGERPH